MEKSRNEKYSRNKQIGHRRKKNNSELECRKTENIQIKGTASNFKRFVRQYQAV